MAQVELFLGSYNLTKQFIGIRKYAIIERPAGIIVYGTEMLEQLAALEIFRRKLSWMLFYQDPNLMVFAELKHLSVLHYNNRLCYELTWKGNLQV